MGQRTPRGCQDDGRLGIQILTGRCCSTALVVRGDSMIDEGIVENEKNALRRDGIWRVGEHGAQDVGPAGHLLFVATPPLQEREGVLALVVKPLALGLDLRDKLQVPG